MIHVKHFILASNSQARKKLLSDVGLSFTAQPAAIAERALEAQWQDDNLGASAIAARLALAKARAVSAQNPDAIVIGADQVLALNERIFAKPDGLSEARQQLLLLRGKTHQLHSALALVKDGETLFEVTTSASLSVRLFSESFLDHYLEAAGEEILHSVGCYHYEGLGLTLFDRIEGDYHTILGLPLLPLLAFFRHQGWSET